MEKPGLLPARPTQDGLDGAEGNRRPADIWVPRVRGAIGQALDLACTSGLRADFLDVAREDAASVFGQYEHFKRTFKDTEAQCKEQHIKFTPLVFESHGGGWSPLARGVLDGFGKSLAACGWHGSEAATLRIAQRISCALHRGNAPAILRRLAPPVTQSGVTSWSQVRDLELS